MENNHQIIIVGGGPAGISCLIQLLRSGLKPLLISKEIGGNVRNANLIENLIGFPGGIRGDIFAELIKKQLGEYQFPMLRESVKSIIIGDGKKNEFKIETLTKTIFCEFLIVATGTIPKKLQIENEKMLQKEGKLFYNFYTIPEEKYNEEFAIVGSGDVAYDYALNLTSNGAQVSIIQRSKDSKSLTLLQQRVIKNQRIEIIRNYSVHGFHLEPSNRLTLKLRNMNESEKRNKPETQKRNKWETDNVLIAIGRKPNIEFLEEELKKKISESTAHPNLHIIGDVNEDSFRQISIAMGEGIKVAMEIVSDFD